MGEGGRGRWRNTHDFEYSRNNVDLFSQHKMRARTAGVGGEECLLCDPMVGG